MEKDEIQPVDTGRALIDALEEVAKEVEDVKLPEIKHSKSKKDPIVVNQLARDIMGMAKFEQIVKATSDFVTSRFKNGLTKEQVEKVHKDNSLEEN